MFLADEARKGPTMDAMGSRIDMLTKQLLAANTRRESDHNEAYFRTHVAFLRILRKDPDLTGKITPMKTRNA